MKKKYFWQTKCNIWPLKKTSKDLDPKLVPNNFLFKVMISYVLENAINVFGGFKVTLGYTSFLPKMVTNLLMVALKTLKSLIAPSNLIACTCT